MDENKQEADAGLESKEIVATLNTARFASFLSFVEQIANTVPEYDRDHLTMTDFLSLVYCEAGNRGNTLYKEYAYDDDEDEQEDSSELSGNNISPMWTEKRPIGYFS